MMLSVTNCAQTQLSKHGFLVDLVALARSAATLCHGWVFFDYAVTDFL